MAEPHDRPDETTQADSPATTAEPTTSNSGPRNVPEPDADPEAEPAPEPAPAPEAEPAPEPEAEPAPEPPAEPEAEPAPEPPAEPEAEPAPEPPAEPEAEPAPEPPAAMTPPAGPRQDAAVRPGAVARGTVVEVTAEDVVVQFLDGRTGSLSRAELRQVDGTDDIAAGEILEVYVEAAGAADEPLRLSRTLARGARTPDDLARCFEAGLPVEGKIGKRRKGGFDVFIVGQRAFLPMSQADIRPVTDESALEGLICRFTILEMDRRRRNIVVSRRRVLEQERRARRAALGETLAAGQVLDGTVRQIKEYGAFVDVGGIEGLVHVSEISWDRVDDPADVLSVGDAVKVKVLRFGKNSGKLSLSIRAATPNPWDALGETFVEGGTYTGTVVRFEEFGAFVQLAEGLDGLVHNSEVSWDPAVRHASDAMEVGQQIEVKLLGFDRRRRRISLSVKGLTEDPWTASLADIKVGSTARGTVEKVAKFGVFVTLAPGVTALLPVSRSGVPREVSLHRRFKVGAEVEAEVIEIDARRRRITLSRSGPEDGVDREAQAYLRQQARQQQGFGTLGDLLGSFDAGGDDE